MANSRKRKGEELDISEITESCSSATVHGMVSDVSPVKSSRKNADIKYFDCRLSDGKKSYAGYFV